MAKENYYRLCGGTFFTLVLQAIRPRMKAREHYSGESDGLTNPEVLAGLFKVINPDYADPGKEVLKGTANNYKACKSATGVYLPFCDMQVVSAFDYDVQNDFQTVLNRMIMFVDDFIDPSATVHKDANLVKALAELVWEDDGIDLHAKFHIGLHGEEVERLAFDRLENVCLPAFLLGIWHYIIAEHIDNSVGKETYDEWCPSNGGGPRSYTAHMGEGFLDGLKVYHINTISNSIPDDEPVETVLIDDVKDNQQESVHQTVNNPFVFTFNQYGANGTQIGHVENYYAGKKEC